MKKRITAMVSPEVFDAWQLLLKQSSIRNHLAVESALLTVLSVDRDLRLVLLGQLKSKDFPRLKHWRETGEFMTLEQWNERVSASRIV